MESLSSSELKVMNLIWNNDVELNSKDITTTFEKKYKTTKATTMTFLKRLEKQGYITSKKIGRVTEYKVEITKEKFINTSFNEYINKIYKGSANNFLKSLIKSGSLSDLEIEELINKLKKKTQGFFIYIENFIKKTIKF